MVLSLCATAITVWFPATSSNVLQMVFSVSKSSADVGSSSRKIGAFFTIALAIVSLCLCPPDRLFPFSVRTVSIPSGNALINSSQPDILSAIIISSLLTSGLPIRILSAIDIGNNVASCEISANFLRFSFGVKL